MVERHPVVWRCFVYIIHRPPACIYSVQYMPEWGWSICLSLNSSILYWLVLVMCLCSVFWTIIAGGRTIAAGEKNISKTTKGQFILWYIHIFNSCYALDGKLSSQSLVFDVPVDSSGRPRLSNHESFDCHVSFFSLSPLIVNKRLDSKSISLAVFNIKTYYDDTMGCLPLVVATASTAPTQIPFIFESLIHTNTHIDSIVCMEYIK